MLDNAGSFGGLPLDKLDEVVIAPLGFENPGARARSIGGGTQGVP